MESLSHFFAVSPLGSKRLSVRGLGVLESRKACMVTAAGQWGLSAELFLRSGVAGSQ